MHKFKNTSFFLLIIFLFKLNVVSSKEIPVGHLVDFTGPTSSVGKPFGQGFIDAIKYINKNGGIKGNKIKVDTVDYSTSE